MPHDLSWDEYNAHQADRAPRPLLGLAVRAWRDGTSSAGTTGPVGSGTAERRPVAVDLGCGEGIETTALLDAGWEVHAVDAEAAALARLADRTGAVHRDRLTVQHRSFAQLSTLPPADLVHSSYALPYCAPAHFGPLWTAVRDCLRPGGVLALQLFGDRDSAAPDPGMTFHTRAEAEALLDGLQIVHWDEEDAMGTSYTGPKHWHVFHVVARRPSTTTS